MKNTPSRSTPSAASRLTPLALLLALASAPYPASGRGHEDRAGEAEPDAGSRTAGEQAFERAYAAHHARDYATAIAGWTEAIAAGARPATSMYNLACAHARAGHTDQALHWLEQAREQGFDLGRYLERDTDLAALRREARFRMLVERFGDGTAARLVSRLEQMELHDDGDGASWYRLAMKLHRAGDYPRAERGWERAAALGFREAASTYNIACARSLDGNRPGALRALERAIELGFGSGHELRHDDDLDALRDEAGFARLVRLADELALPDGGGDRSGLDGRERDLWQDARARYERHVAEHPARGRAWFNLGFATLRLEAPARAIEAFGRAHQLGYRPAVSAYNLACAHARASERDEAFAWLERARELGFDAEEQLATDPDLDSLRDDPRFPRRGWVEADGRHRHQQRQTR